MVAELVVMRICPRLVDAPGGLLSNVTAAASGARETRQLQAGHVHRPHACHVILSAVLSFSSLVHSVWQARQKVSDCRAVAVTRCAR